MNRHIQNYLDDVADAEAEAEILTHPVMFPSFDAWVAAFPEGERFRNWLAPHHDDPALFCLVRGKGTHESLPGGYIWVSLSLFFTSTSRNRPAIVRPAMIAVGDCDDGLITREFLNDEMAQDCFNELKALAPFNFDDLIEAYGFQF